LGHNDNPTPSPPSWTLRNDPGRLPTTVDSFRLATPKAMHRSNRAARARRKRLQDGGRWDP